MTSGARDALLRVANSFLEQDRPLHAIKCLEAICMSKKTEFPEMEAEVLIKVVASTTARKPLFYGESCCSKFKNLFLTLCGPKLYSDVILGCGGN